MDRYALKHADYDFEPWHVFLVYLVVTWMACFTVCFFNRALPTLNYVGAFLVLGGFLITVAVV